MAARIVRDPQPTAKALGHPVKGFTLFKIGDEIAMPTWTLTRCAHCGAQITQRDRGRPRRYFTPACRTAAYRVTKATTTAQEQPALSTHQAAAVTPAPPSAAPTTQDGG